MKKVIETLDKNGVMEMLYSLFGVSKIEVMPTSNPILKGDVIYNPFDNKFYQSTKDYKNGVNSIEGLALIKIGLQQIDLDKLKKKLSLG